MYLEKLEIQGFKSFADKTTLEFEKGITCIVGSNGMGKSNVAESVRWVMGEQSLKTMRMKRGEDVIFTGSNRRARSGFAEVNLHLNNEDRAAPVDWTQVVLGRRLYRSGESDYLINGNKVRLADVVMLLAAANFGARTYAVIGQGMIDQIIMQSPEERKEFFDEAVGVRQFQIKKEQAENKLEATENNLRQVEALLAEIEPRLRSLRRQVKKLEERKTLEEELHALQHIYYGIQWRELEEKYKKQKQLSDEKEKILAVKRADLRKLADELAHLEKKETKSSEFLRLQTDYQKLLNERGQLRERQLELKYKIATVRETHSTGPTVAELSDDLEHIEKLSGDLILYLGETKLDLAKIRKVVDELHALSNSVMKRIRRKEAVSPELEKELKDIDSSLKNIEESVQEVDSKLKSLATEEAKERVDFFSLQRQFQTKQNEVFSADRDSNEIKIELARLETRREALTGEMTVELGERKERVIQEVKNVAGAANLEETGGRIGKIKYQLSMIGGIDPETTKEYEETNSRYEFLSSQVLDVKKSIIDLNQVVEDLEETIGRHFDTAFGKINDDFGRFFKSLFGGGEAKLIKKIEEGRSEAQAPPEADEFAGATEPYGSDQGQSAVNREAEKRTLIEIQASPPGKRIKNLQMLSGGEKALTSIALLCAILSNNPSPFVVLDEVDAALDESNAIRFAKILEELAHRTQFIVITHNRYTMENARVLYGVTMGEDSVSRILSLKLEEALKV